MSIPAAPTGPSARLRCLGWSLIAATWAGCISGCGTFRRGPERPVATAASLPTASPVRYREVAEAAGLRYTWGPRNRSPLTNLETFGAGCAFLDVNQDDLLDVLAVGKPGIRLFQATAPGRYEDRTAQFHLDRFTGHWIGIACGDYDGDGWVDLLITGFHRLLLLRNLQGTGFSDATAAASLKTDNWGRWGSSAGFADLDGDGDLDLVVMNYVPFGPKAKQFCELAPGVVSGCPPNEYDPEYTRIYRNSGGRYEDVTVRSGCTTTHGKGLVVAFCDYNGDGKTDFYLGNDGTPSDLLLNLGGFKFRNVGIETGAAFGTEHQPTAAMGADWGDYDRDGKWDLVSSAFADEEYTLLRQKDGMFEPITDQVGMGLPTFKPLGFGAKFLDADNDGRLDIHFVNGHVYDNVPFIDPSSHYAQPMMLFHQRDDGTVEDLVPRITGAFTDALVGRGSAVGDYDNDGRQDLLVVDFEGRLRLYHNESPPEAHWLTLQLHGKQPGNRQAYGAQVVLKSTNGAQLGQVAPASSYLSSSDARVHFGLGKDDHASLLQVRWPSGKTQEARDLPADQLLEWTEGEAAPHQIASH